MRYILKGRNLPAIEFPDYQDAMFALSRANPKMDNITLHEIDEHGNVHNVIESEELDKIVTEIRGIVGGSVLLGGEGRTLESDE